MNPVLSETAAPGGVYLCQVSEQLSCAACCGLYNVVDCSYTALQKMLSHRSDRFALLPRTADAIIEFGRKIAAGQVLESPWADFHHCPFIGLIGNKRQRVGCLLHPLAEGNNGVDYRGLSYYGGMACRQYFCPAHRDLAPEIKTIVQRLAAGWYDYGLIVTETALLGALVAEIEKRLAAPISLADVLDRPAALRVLRDVLYLKIDWPYRHGSVNSLCHYFFADRRYGREPVDYGRAGRDPVGFETIFTELTSGFQTADDLLSAEQRLDCLFQKAADALGGSLL